MKRRSPVGRLFGLSLLLVGMLAFALALQKLTAPNRLVATIDHGIGSTAIRFSPDGRWLLSTGYEDATAQGPIYSTRILRTDNWKVAHLLSGVDRVGGFTADSRQFLALRDTGEGEIWEIGPAGGWRRRPKPLPLKDCKSAILSPDGRLLAAILNSRPGLTLYRTDPYQRLARMTEATELAGFSPDGRLLAYATYNKAAGWKYLFTDLKTLRTLHEAPGHCVAFSADGTLAAGADGNGTIKIWDTHTWKLLRTLHARDGFISSLAFSPDTQLLAVGNNREALVLDSESGRVLMRFPRSFSDRQVAFAPHAPLLAVLAERRVGLWQVPPLPDLRLRASFRRH